MFAGSQRPDSKLVGVYTCQEHGRRNLLTRPYKTALRSSLSGDLVTQTFKRNLKTFLYDFNLQ